MCYIRSVMPDHVGTLHVYILTVYIFYTDIDLYKYLTLYIIESVCLTVP